MNEVNQLLLSVSQAHRATTVIFVDSLPLSANLKRLDKRINKQRSENMHNIELEKLFKKIDKELKSKDKRIDELEQALKAVTERVKALEDK